MMLLSLRSTWHKTRGALRTARRAARHRLRGIDDRRLLFIACFPKSGSTYLMRLLGEITRFPRVHPVEFTGPNEQEFSRRELERIRYRDGVCHQHVKGTANNVRLAQEHGLRVAVQVRDIFDVVPSLNDHLHNEDSRFTTGYVHREFFGMTQPEKWMFLIRVHLPWYFNFLLSWHEAQEELPVRWVGYEELFADRVGVVGDLLRFWDVPCEPARIEQAVEAVRRKPTRLNKGVAGRGSGLGPEHRQAILELADACQLPDPLRARIGLPESGAATGNHLHRAAPSSQTGPSPAAIA